MNMNCRILKNIWFYLTQLFVNDENLFIISVCYKNWFLELKIIYKSQKVMYRKIQKKYDIKTN